MVEIAARNRVMALSLDRRWKRAGCDLHMRPRKTLTRVMASPIARRGEAGADARDPFILRIYR